MSDITHDMYFPIQRLIVLVRTQIEYLKCTSQNAIIYIGQEGNVYLMKDIAKFMTAKQLTPACLENAFSWADS